MADSSFFVNCGPFALGDLAQRAAAELAAPEMASRLMRDVAPLDVAGPEELSFLDNRKYTGIFAASAAGACIAGPELVDKAPPGMALLVSAEPYRAYAKIAALFYPVPAPEPGISPLASIHPTASIGIGCRIEPGAVIGAQAVIGARSVVGPNAVIGPGVRLGEDCRVGAVASVSHAAIGDRVVLYPGVRVGQDGFGYAMGAGGHLKVPQLGRVIIGDDVEIGANTTIDRGAGPDTVIGAGSKIDNLVQIGHNVRLGRFCIIAAQAGISGSTQIGDFVAIGGQAGLTGHLKIGTAARIAAQSGVMRDVAARETVAGSPATSRIEWLRQCALIGKLRQSPARSPVQDNGSRQALESPGRRVRESRAGRG